MKKLKIDTSSNQKLLIELQIEGKNIVESSTQTFGSQGLLNLITRTLEKNHLKLKDLNQIEVNTGPGSFTGLRVGVSVANALAYSLGILVNGKEIETEIIY